MCEPRRVAVTVTRQVREAWEREIERAAEASRTVTGEARIRQALDASVGASALLALQAALARGVPGWHDDAGGYRHDVPGGFVRYDPAARTLEIVARASETVTRSATARARLAGEVADELSVQRAQDYYGDGWGGRTREWAEAQARAAGDRAIDALRETIAAQAAAAEQAQAAALAAAAAAQAQQAAEAAAADRQAALATRAAEELRDVGTAARLAFNRLLAGAYRDALVALARRRGVPAGAIRQTETQDRLELEFLLPD